MTAAPRLSVVIPVHDAVATLGEQLAAVVAATRDDDEVIVVDNLSTDGSRELALDWTRTHPRVRVVDARERPLESHARNVGVAAARSELIAFCDADDVVAPTWADAMAAALATHDYVTGPVDIDRLNPPWLAEVRGRAIFEELPRTYGDIPFAHGCNIGVRRSVAAAVRFDETVRIGADVAFAIDLWARGHELAWEPGAVIHYRHRASVRGRWRQSRGFGRADAELERRAAAAGAPIDRNVETRRRRRRVLWLAHTVPRAVSRAHRTRWLFTLGVVSGGRSARRRSPHRPSDVVESSR